MNIRRALDRRSCVIAVASSRPSSAARETRGHHDRATSRPLPFVSRPYASHTDRDHHHVVLPRRAGRRRTVGGEVVVANPTDTARTVGSRCSAPGARRRSPRRSRCRLATTSPSTSTQVMTAPFVSAIVEIDGGEGMVEQRAIYPAGNAVASCTTSTSSTWYFADGLTVDGSTEYLIITNPIADTVSVEPRVRHRSGPAANRPPSRASRSRRTSVKVVSVAESRLRRREHHRRQGRSPPAAG